MSTPIERLTAFRDHILATDKTLNAYRFEQMCCLSNGYFKSRSTYNNERGISADSIIKVKNAFPQLNVEWVLLGTGTMLEKPKGIPLYAIPFSTIPLTINGEPSPDITPTAHISLTKCHVRCASSSAMNIFACLSSDHAMLPSISPGSVLILRKMDISELKASHLGRPFAVILTDGSRLIRHLAENSSRSLTLTPDSNSPAFSPVNIKIKTVTHIFAITASVHIYES